MITRVALLAHVIEIIATLNGQPQLRNVGVYILQLTKTRPVFSLPYKLFKMINFDYI